MYVHICMYVCICMCVCSMYACMYVHVCLSVCVSVSVSVWWRPGGVRGSSCWSCKPTTGVHHVYTSYNAQGGACIWTRSFDIGPCYCLWPIHPSGGSPAWPKFKACKQITQRPLVGRVDTFHGGLGWTGSLKVSRPLCVYVHMYIRTYIHMYVRSCMYVHMYT